MFRPARRVASIDIGSNTVHLSVLDVRRSRPTKPIDSSSVILKLGAVISERHHLPKAVLSKLRHVLKRYLHVARKKGAQTVLIGATQAMRSLPGHAAILARLSRAIGEPIRLLSGERESALGFLGVKSEIRARECVLLIDSGGASTELTLVKNARALEAVSISLGAAVLSTQLASDPPTAYEVARLMVPIIRALRAAPRSVVPRRALLTGGTAHHLLQVAHGQPDRLTRKDLEHALKRLLQKPARKIAKHFDMEEDRARLLVPGTLLLTALLDLYNLDHLRVTQRGLRDGMAQAFLISGQRWAN